MLCSRNCKAQHFCIGGAVLSDQMFSKEPLMISEEFKLFPTILHQLCDTTLLKEISTIFTKLLL